MKPSLKTLALLLCCLLTAASRLFSQTPGECETKYFFNLYTNIDAQPIPRELAACDDGGVIMVGTVNKPDLSDVTDGFFSRIDKNGSVTWMKLLKGIGNEVLYSVTKLSDGSYAAFGTYGGYNEGVVFLKFDLQGNIIWRKEYQSANGLEMTGNGKIREDKDGSLIVFSNFVENYLSFNNRVLFFKISTTGNLLFSKFYYPPGLSLMGGRHCVVKDGSTYIAGSSYEYNGWRGTMMKINNGTGDLNWVKAYDLNAGQVEFSQIFDAGSNSFYVTAFNVSANYVIDTSGNCTSTSYIKVPLTSRTAVMSTNHELFWTHYLDINMSTFSMARFDPAGNVATVYQLDKPIDPVNTDALANTDGNLFFAGFTGYSGVNYMYLAKFSPLGELGCPSTASGLTVESVPHATTTLNWETRTRVYTGFVANVTVEPALIPAQSSICSASIKDRCDTIKIQMVQGGCTISDTIKLLARKNPNCTSPASWSFDKTATRYVDYASDSGLTILYTKPWQGYVYAEIKTGCKLVRDSVFLSLTGKTDAFDIGRDTIICPGEKMLLYAPAGYSRYTWQNGSSDSVLLVNQPGVYWLSAQNNCQTFTDSLVVNSPGSLLFDLGADTSVCPGDTILLSAPAGFVNYSWAPNDRISYRDPSTVLLFPGKNSTYYVSAAKQGCPVTDSIRIRVQQVSKIDLGADTSFCQGDSIIINAGAGFFNYKWSNGSSAPQIIGNNKGLYSVRAMDANGCVVSDTIAVLNLFPRPFIHLPQDGFICNNAGKLLNAGGGFKKYLWSTGAVSDRIHVNTMGRYWVYAVDEHNCSASDSVVITGIKNAPANFLPKDTSICENSAILIRPLNSFQSYLWSTGTSADRLEISKAAVYWARVTDQYNCVGMDSITISSRQCIEGFHVPSAFTPNNDGLNDIFRPVIGGIVSNYHFSIYNRYGEMVFESRSLLQGWDGTYRGIKQGSGAYVWQCQFQLNGGAITLKKGTVVLVN